MDKRIVSIMGSTEFDECPVCHGIHATYIPGQKTIKCTMCGKRLKIKKATKK